jgi:hypothetical protein
MSVNRSDATLTGEQRDRTNSTQAAMRLGGRGWPENARREKFTLRHERPVAD